MKSTEQEQLFLDEVYRKARLLEYDKCEAQKVLHNRKVLARRQILTVSGITIVTAVFALMIWVGKVDQGLCVALSLLLITAGLLIEKLELLWSLENDG
ncbi:hypothetical protein C162_33523 [Paenibacillus sp. FSL R7-269]|uniref:hypothetical protein n=1 Tax=Paenibacillus sp. FSL R7-269 TaxID=1226755 RepID=UPI0003E260C6|nr:hypothetical protein [Paenibacillus sp. FSL R7-269]ETT30232.1 hypothetical protein C162_33523 [Paenibacillus sp. FSL R7-269]